MTLCFALFEEGITIITTNHRFNKTLYPLILSGYYVMKKFKEEDLILYLYKDCSPKMAAAIEEALELDLELQARLQVLRRTMKQLDKLKLKSPSKKSIKTIIEHANRSGR